MEIIIQCKSCLTNLLKFFKQEPVSDGLSVNYY